MGMSATIDTIRTTEPTPSDASDERVTDDPARKTLDVSGLEPERVTAYAKATAEEGHPELYFERKGGRTFLIAR